MITTLIPRVPLHERICEAERRMTELGVGYGLEPIWDKRQCATHPVAVYINMGDTYRTTIVYDTLNAVFRVMSWGDWLEEYEEQHGTIGE